MFNSQFDATSAFFGGGFVPTQPSQFIDSNPSPARSRDSQGLVPLTVKLISEASQSGDDRSNFVINGLEVTDVTLVGIVFNKDERASDVSFTLDDGTREMECKRWANEAFDIKELQAIQDGMYVRVNGHLKSFQEKKQLVAFSVRPVTNFDEVTFHYIDCIYFQMHSSKSQFTCQLKEDLALKQQLEFYMERVMECYVALQKVALDCMSNTWLICYLSWL